REWLTAEEIMAPLRTKPAPGSPAPWLAATRLTGCAVRARNCGPRRWAEITRAGLDAEASASSVEALRLAHRVVGLWLRRQVRCAPPLVILWGIEELPFEAAVLTRSLRVLTTPDGHVRVVHANKTARLARSADGLSADRSSRTDGTTPL